MMDRRLNDTIGAVPVLDALDWSKGLGAKNEALRSTEEMGKMAGMDEGTVGRIAGMDEGTVDRIAGMDEGTVGRIAGMDEGTVGRIAGMDEGTVGRIAGMDEGTIRRVLRVFSKTLRSSRITCLGLFVTVTRMLRCLRCRLGQWLSRTTLRVMHALPP